MQRRQRWWSRRYDRCSLTSGRRRRFCAVSSRLRRRCLSLRHRRRRLPHSKYSGEWRLHAYGEADVRWRCSHPSGIDDFRCVGTDRSVGCPIVFECCAGRSGSLTRSFSLFHLGTALRGRHSECRRSPDETLRRDRSNDGNYDRTLTRMQPDIAAKNEWVLSTKYSLLYRI